LMPLKTLFFHVALMGCGERSSVHSFKVSKKRSCEASGDQVLLRSHHLWIEPVLTT
jgi:hypothetical protein